MILTEPEFHVHAQQDWATAQVHVYIYQTFPDGSRAVLTKLIDGDAVFTSVEEAEIAPVSMKVSQALWDSVRKWFIPRDAPVPEQVAELREALEIERARVDRVLAKGLG
jgi:hypothetical protein